MKLRHVFMIFVIVALLLIIPCVVNAATVDATETTTTSTGKIVNWKYSLNANNEITDLVCSNVDAVTGDLVIPDTIDEHKVIGIGYSAFRKCYGLTGVTFSNNIQTIANYAFESCSGLSSITLPNNITSLGNGSFESCSGLKNITLSNSISRIPDRCFKSCSGLTSVIIPKSITTLSNSGFEGGSFDRCTRLEKILIPDSVATISEDTFHNCNKLTIYGNDGSVAQAFAEENKIKFDLIANWDKPAGGSDITAPTVQAIRIVSPREGTYKAPQTVKIRVEFSENVVADTVPTLTIKFGTGAERSISNGSIKNNYIEYSYNIQADDNGQLATVSLSSGNVKDASGNAAILSCPIVSGNVIKANTEGSSNNNTSGNSNRKPYSENFQVEDKKVDTSWIDGSFLCTYTFKNEYDSGITYFYIQEITDPEIIKKYDEKTLDEKEYLNSLTAPSKDQLKTTGLFAGNDKKLTIATSSIWVSDAIITKSGLYVVWIAHDTSNNDDLVYGNFFQKMNFDSNSNNTSTSKPNTGNQNANSNNSNGNANSNKDDTVAGGKLPQTGATITFCVIVISTISIGIFALKKYRSLHDIK